MKKLVLFIYMVIIIAACNTNMREQGANEMDSVKVVMENDPGRVKDGIHVLTGLRAEKGYELVWTNCTPCHSAKLITQNRATREGWVSMIRWMQETQNLWDLGPNEEKIIDYLATHYAPEEKGRRQPLADIDWYILEE